MMPPPLVEIQGEMEYKVEKILSKRKRYGDGGDKSKVVNYRGVSFYQRQG